MSGHSTYVPKSAFGKWFESRLPIMGLLHSSFIVFPNPRNLNYFWTFGGILAFMLVAQIVTGVVLAMHYTPHVGLRLQLRRAHHARRELWLADPLPARQRRVDVLHRRLHPHLPRPLLRLLQGAARDPLDPRRDHLPADDGDGLHGLRAAVGPDELLGRHRHHQPVLGHSAGRRDDRDLAVGRLLGRQPDAEPLLLAALPAAVHDRGRRGAAHLGAARSGFQQPDRRREEDREGHAALPPVLHGEGRLRARLLPDVLRVVRLLHPELPRSRGQLHPGEPGRDAVAHRAGMVLPAVLRDPARHPEQADRRDRDVRRRSRSWSSCPGSTRRGSSRLPTARCIRQFFWVFAAVVRRCSAGSAPSRRRVAT